MRTMKSSARRSPTLYSAHSNRGQRRTLFASSSFYISGILISLVLFCCHATPNNESSVRAEILVDRSSHDISTVKADLQRTRQPVPVPRCRKISGAKDYHSVDLDDDLTFFWRLDIQNQRGGPMLEALSLWTSEMSRQQTKRLNDRPPTISGKLVYKGKAWLGWGLSSGDGKMIGSEVIIGFPGSGRNPMKYRLGGTDASLVTLLEKQQQTLPAAYIEQNITDSRETEGEQIFTTSLSFEKILMEKGELVILPRGNNKFVYAIGSSNEFGYHGRSGSFDLDLSICQAKTSEKFSTLNLSPDHSRIPKKHPDKEITGGNRREIGGGLKHNNEKSLTRKTQAEIETSPKSSARYRSAWVAHGAIGAIAWGILVPIALGSAWFRELIPTYWIYIHVFVNVLTFLLSFVAVCVAFGTMGSMGNAGEGHLKELHHIVGLVLLMLVTFQTANGFLRPPREFASEEEDDSLASQRRYVTARAFWYLMHSSNGVFLFALGIWQVHSGLGLFSERFGSPDWGTVYLGYIVWLGLLFMGIKLWMKWKERQIKINQWMDSDVQDIDTNIAPSKFDSI